MIIAVSLVVIALILRVWAKTHERNAATLLTTLIYRGSNRDAIALAGNLIPRPTPAHELRRQIAGSFGILSFIFRFLVSVFAYSLARVDARTPNSFVLRDNEQQFHDLRDADIYRVYMDWRMTYVLDWMSAVFLFLASLRVGWSVVTPL